MQFYLWGLALATFFLQFPQNIAKADTFFGNKSDPCGFLNCYKNVLWCLIPNPFIWNKLV